MKLRFGKVAKYAKIGSKVKEVAAYVEISSGSLNLLIKLSGAKDSELGKELSTLLGWLELLSLGGELTVALGKSLRKSADDILVNHAEELDNLKTNAKNADEVKEIDDLVEHLEVVRGAESSRKTKQYWDNYTFEDMLAGKKPCFLAGTLVHTIVGLKAIEQIQIGDIVLCYDEIKKEIAQQQVSQTFENFTKKYAKLKTASGETIDVTGQHLFYQKTSGTWIKAYQLKVGMHLYNAKTDSLERIISKEVVNKQVTTYNFEVPIHHNYLVGNLGILAHNANRRPSYKDATKRGYAFYELYTLENRQAQTLYIGKTTREDLDLRNSEHKYEGKLNKSKGIKDYTWWKSLLNPNINNLNNNIPEHRFVQMSEFESALWERHYIEEFKVELKKINPDLKLRNRQMPLGKNVNSKTFAKYKAYWDKRDKNFNPCKYF